MAYDPNAVVVRLEFEIPVVGGEPAVNDFGYIMVMAANAETARGLLAAIASVTFHFNMHAIGPAALAMMVGPRPGIASAGQALQLASRPYLS
jgi:hypothetical protein